GEEHDEMKRNEWREAVAELPVFDTHTHLNMPGVSIPAQTFWDIAHYFWFQQELWSVGYPLDAPHLGEAARREAFVHAFNAARNTHWHLIVRTICRDLYGHPLTDKAGLCTSDRIKTLDRAIREHAGKPEWAQSVVDRLAIRHIAVNALAEADFPGLAGVGVAVPTWRDQATWLARVLASSDPTVEIDAAREAARSEVAALKANGIRGMRVSAEPFEAMGKPAVALMDTLGGQPWAPWQAEAAMSHVLFEALAEHGMFAQLFLGVERDVSPRTSMAVDSPRRITDLYPLFERYACGFELVIGAPTDNMAAAQVARIYPNVHLGGLWWYNFRASTYVAAMQARIEAVPASKSAIVASDARCIEWCYGKIVLVKWLLADFLHTQVRQGWLSRDDALWVAREWLHDAAARRYLP
ncbi:MAG: hypothetical protein JXC32_22535, partial [Anaerolineae bacterium]|nr:hypothetical protein [Anaerolineae bacterium]